MEGTDSSSGCSQRPSLPPGFRFHPTDEELVVHYLKRKASSAPLPVAIIAEVDLYKFDPWELPAKAVFGEREWYFFSLRERKYPNGVRPNRAATSGYWKATGTDKPILTRGGTIKIGVKKALVFYRGKPPKGVKTNWVMHEYRLADHKFNNMPPGCDLGNKKNSLRLDDWVLCRIYKKNNTNTPMEHDKDDPMEDMLGSVHPLVSNGSQNSRLQLPKRSSYGATLLENERNLFEGMTNKQGINNITTMSQLVTSPSNPMFPLERTLPPMNWTYEDSCAGASPGKRFRGDNNNGTGVVRTNGNNYLLPQTPPPLHLQQVEVMGSLGDGILLPPFNQLHGINSYT